MEVNTIAAEKHRMQEFKALIHLATKAPSGHNTQPWDFKVTETGIEIHPDFDRSLPVVDPEDRELYISLGCALENLLVAANAFDYDYSYKIVKNNCEYFIRIDLIKSEKDKNDPMFSYIDLRQTNRSIYNGKFVPDEELRELISIKKEKNIKTYSFKRGEIDFYILKEYITKGNEIQMNDPEFREEFSQWNRFNTRHVSKTRDGLTYKVLGYPSMPKLIGKSVMKSFLRAKTLNKIDLQKINSSSHFILFTAKNNAVSDWISLGVTLERFLLLATKKRIACAYLNQPCEVTSLADNIKASFSINNEIPNILLRIGYANSVPFSPRKKVETLIH